MRTWLLPPLFGIALLLLIPIVVVFTPPVRATWDPARRADASAPADRRDAGSPVGRAHAGGGAPPDFIGSIVLRAALEEAVRRMPPRTDGQERQWSYAVAGDEWTRRSPLEMTVADTRGCATTAERDACLASRVAFAHARIVRAEDTMAEVDVTWAAGRAHTGVLRMLLTTDRGRWHVRAARDQGAPPAAGR